MLTTTCPFTFRAITLGPLPAVYVTSGENVYTVVFTAARPVCNCGHFLHRCKRHGSCKHVDAAKIWRHRQEQDAQAEQVRGAVAAQEARRAQALKDRSLWG